MKFTTDDVLKHYRNEADLHGEEGTSTVRDMRTRNLEIAAISKYVCNGMKILEVGCGNGYTSHRLVEKFTIDIDAIDFTCEMIDIAQQRSSESSLGKVSFSCQDILLLDKENTYDAVFTERCLQNLVSWEHQKRALQNIVKSLKLSGELILMESFTTGHNTLNSARSELDLPDIAPSWHNLFFDEQKTIDYMESIGCRYIDQDAFLSGYYFGSRLILPAIMPKNKEVSSMSVLNDYFCHLPAYGDFCPIKIVRFCKSHREGNR